MTDTDSSMLLGSILHHLQHSLGKDPEQATTYDWRMSLSLALRDKVVGPWLQSISKTREAASKRVYYLSMEFLLGRLIDDVAVNLGLHAAACAAMTELGQDFDVIVADEPDAALGNGGLGRLAACFMDSLSTLSIPAVGYGIRYEHGLFEQHFEEGRQVEVAETWLARRQAWEFARPEVSYPIKFGGSVSVADGSTHWRPSATVVASAYDTPIIGWQKKWANTLRLWSARPTLLFDLDRFNEGDYAAAAEPENQARTITRVLYPDDTSDTGQELRLKQEYFFTSASIQDILHRFLSEGHALDQLSAHVAIQLNDTHPAVAGPELVRLLVDEQGLPFDQSVLLARDCLGYTNHTLLPEALERWPESLFARLLPRHYQIIQQIESGLLASEAPGVRILQDGAVKMGELAFVMAHKVNGVSALHSQLVKKTVFSELHRAYPGRIINQTNGVTPRRWLYTCNPALRDLITDSIGASWPGDLERLQEIEPHVDDATFLDRYAQAKLHNKTLLANWLQRRHDIAVDPHAMFDIQIKRVHEYKRQLMNILETIALWNDMHDNPHAEWVPRVKWFGGKAAPGYVMAKSIVHLINDVANTINRDPLTRDYLKIVYPENYNVSMAEILIPAADLSEQISSAGKEASGTGNMKLSLNGALTIGTLDGANVEIRERVGEENFFLFGMTASEAMQRVQQEGHARRAIQDSPRLARVLDQIAAGTFSAGDTGRYHGLLENLRQSDNFLVTGDFDAYYAAQREVDAAFRLPTNWTRMAALNTARLGWFSSDRTIAGYARDIWGVVSLADHSQRKTG